MDWSQHLDSTGEDLQEGQWERVHTRVGFLHALNAGSYTPTFAYLFTVNYILGVGVLNMPYAFFKSGVILSCTIAIICSFVAYATTLWVANCAQVSLEIITLERGNAFQSPILSKAKKDRIKEKEKERERERERRERGLGSQKDKDIAMSYLLLDNLESGNNTNYNSIDSADSADSEAVNKSPKKTSSTRQSQRSPTRIPRIPKAASPARGTAGAGGTPLFGTESTTNGYTINTIQKQQHQTTNSNAMKIKDQDQEPEVTELVETFLGLNYKIGYQICLSLLTYSGMIAYTQVFVSSIKTQLYPSISAESRSDIDSSDSNTGDIGFGIDIDIEIQITLLFSLIVIPLSCLKLEEQVTTQVIMSVLRFVSLFALLIGLLAAIYSSSMNSPTGIDKKGNEIFPFSRDNMPLVNTNGLGLMFATCVFSQLFQHSVPGLIRPLSKEQKLGSGLGSGGYGGHGSDTSTVPMIFGGALFTTCFIYCTIGVVAVYHLGNHINQSININFVGFKWGLDSHSDPHYLYLANVASMVVVLFPAFDTLSIFPLIANTLGGNLHASFPNLLYKLNWCQSTCTYSKEGKNYLSIDTSDNISNNNNVTTGARTHQIIWRVLAAMPPIVISLFITDLSMTLQLAGLCGIVVALIIPALLTISTASTLAHISSSGIGNGNGNGNDNSNEKVRKFVDSMLSIYIPWASYPWFRDTLPYAVIFMSVCMLGVCIAQIVIGTQ
jgi:amino acid permease